MRRGPVQAAALRVAAARRRSLVLCYHRVAETTDPGSATPTHTTDDLRGQIDALRDIGPIVGLDELLSGEAEPPAFVLTFDDDYESHATVVLPVLQAAGVTATFFVSGRALHGRGPYWWQRLDHLAGTSGLDELRRDLGITSTTPREIAREIEGTAKAEAIGANDKAGSSELSADAIRALVDAGMTIGFHTVDHSVLPSLDDRSLVDALVLGRQQLQDLLDGERLHYFSYPHGRAGPREVAAVREAGYTAALTTSWSPYAPGVDRWQIGRWDPPPSSLEGFAGRVALRLNAPISGVA